MRKQFISVIVVLVAGIAYGLAIAKPDLFLLMWVAPVPVLWIALRSRFWFATVCTFLAYALSVATQCVVNALAMPAEIAQYIPVMSFVMAMLLSAVIMTIITLLMRYCVAKHKDYAALLLFPASVVVVEYLASFSAGAATTDSIAYTQMPWLSLIQLASITGIWGITFLLSWVPAGFALALHRKSWRFAALPVLLLLLVNGYGVWRLHHYQPVATVKVGLVAAHGTIDDMRAEDIEQRNTTINGYGEQVQQLAAKSAEIVLLPEKIMRVKPSEQAAIVERFSAIARTYHVALVVGLNYLPLQDGENVALVFDTEGQLKLRYVKQKLVPFSSEKINRAGDIDGFFAFAGHKFGVAICHDMDFQGLGRSYGKQQPLLILVPGLDFIVDAATHARPAMMRGVESGYAVTRAGQWGMLFSSDAFGRLYAYQATTKQPVTALAELPLYQVNTLYTHWGDWWAWLCVAILVGSFLLLIVSRSK